MSRALVVEANRGLRRSLVRVLQQRRSAVVGVAASREAIAELNAGGIDLIVVALSLPDGDAFDVVMRAKSLVPPPGIVVISEVAGTEHEQALRKLGVSGFLRRPFGIEAVDAVVERAWQRHGHEHS